MTLGSMSDWKRLISKEELKKKVSKKDEIIWTSWTLFQDH